MDPQPDDPSWPLIIGKLLFVILLAYLSITLLTQPQPWTFFDNANFLIHEFGHLIFRGFNEFWYLLGGSLFQVLVPLAIVIYFFLSRQVFAAGFALFWLGDNLINVSVYIKDAQSQILPIIGEGHDWNQLLTQAGNLTHSELLGNLVYYPGAILVVIGVILCSVIVIQNILQRLK